MDLKSFCLDQLARYPALDTQDLVKALYQREFGCGHMITDPQRGISWLEEELTACRAENHPMQQTLIEPLGPFCRVHLRALDAQGLSAQTLLGLFMLSAETPAGSMDAFRAQLEELEALIDSGALPLDASDAHAFLSSYLAAGCPATHHSPAFSAAYRPAYRVIKAEYARLIPVFAAIDQLLQALTEEKPRAIVAIEGGSATGKTTLAALLGRVHDCSIFHMDDFFLQPHQRTPERFAQPGGNVDHERFLAEVLEPLAKGNPFDYQPFSCSTMALADAVHAAPAQLNIVEGAYSMHPALSAFYDLSVFLTIDPQLQAARILRRNGPAMQQRFLNEWIPLEQRYFAAYDIPTRCDLLLHAE